MHSHNPDEVLEASPSASAPDDPLASARALLAAEERTRMEACAEELQLVLARHGMRLDVTPAQISIVPA